ncbi:hypothetical protein [Cellulomonas sp. S1-8]|uniref:hypothetical protein n=1 Tax=Cellulomonas sp. S1-8 TaxID=2904790 RepID=UPI002244DBE4|nr:hypothetical protein [Cellulomonas sp. S1-8]UZN02810.1 hypothetical protein OKX07_17405 [Cellulomonas sp. S1-8]
MTSRVEPLHDLRLERRALRAERDRVSWWRRVVRARMDLAVASAATPGPLGEQVAFALPLDVCLQVPRAGDLRDVLPPAVSGHELGLLPELRDLDARLAAYAEGVEGALTNATSRLVERLADDPAAVLRGSTAAG